MSKPRKPLDLSKYDTSEIYSALCKHPEVIGIKIWSKTDLLDEAIQAVVDGTDLDNEHAKELADKIVEDVAGNDKLLRDQLSDCTDSEWDAIKSAVESSFNALSANH